jgi:hypothetical protein
MITIQKVTNTVPSVSRQSPDIYWHAEDRVQYSTVRIPNVFCDSHLFACFFPCNHQMHRDFLITLYIHTYIRTYDLHTYTQTHKHTHTHTRARSEHPRSRCNANELPASVCAATCISVLKMKQMCIGYFNNNLNNFCNSLALCASSCVSPEREVYLGKAASRFSVLILNS